MAAKRRTTNGKTHGPLEAAMVSLARTVEETRRTMEESQRRTDESRRVTDERIAHADERIARAEEAAAARSAELNDRHNEQRRHSDEMFFELSKSNARIEKRLDHIEAVLDEHGRVLERLPEAIRQQIGFGRPAQP
jgi:chromosome segregation ATPase